MTDGNTSHFVIYQSDDGHSKLDAAPTCREFRQVRTEGTREVARTMAFYNLDQTVWLTQREMAQLFDVSTDNAGLHLKNIFADGELRQKPVTEESAVTAAADTPKRRPYS